MCCDGYGAIDDPLSVQAAGRYETTRSGEADRHCVDFLVIVGSKCCLSVGNPPELEEVTADLQRREAASEAQMRTQAYSGHTETDGSPNSDERLLEFVSDAFTEGRRFRILAVVDDFTRENSALIADVSPSGSRVVRELQALCQQRGYPTTVVSDNGTELTSTAVLKSVQETGID